jgi:hypothetical protein
MKLLDKINREREREEEWVCVRERASEREKADEAARPDQ